MNSFVIKWVNTFHHKENQVILREIPTKNGMSPWADILFQCDNCGCEYMRKNRSYIKSKEHPLYDKDYCRKCWQSILNKQPEYRKKMSESLKKMRKDNPDLTNRMVNTFKERKCNQGDKNAMKRPEVRKKMSATRSYRLANDEELRKMISQNTADAWANGKFEGVSVGQCKWHEYKHSNGNIYKVQGTWELAFIEWLDKENMIFKCHKGRIPYNKDGINKSYYPDFWVEEWKCYVDVKAECFYDESKFIAIKKSNQNIDIKILFKKDLIDLGVNI